MGREEASAEFANERCDDDGDGVAPSDAWRRWDGERKVGVSICVSGIDEMDKRKG